MKGQHFFGLLGESKPIDTPYSCSFTNRISKLRPSYGSYKCIQGSNSTCHHIETISIKAITSNANVFSAAHITVRPMYIHKNSHFGVKYPPPLFVPVESRIILCNVCDPAYAFSNHEKHELPCKHSLKILSTNFNKVPESLSQL